MKGDTQIIELLNEALRNELTAVNQYWLHYRLLDHWGIERLAQFERHESIDEMKHADELSERILFLDGLPNFQALGRLAHRRERRGNPPRRPRARGRGGRDAARRGGALRERARLTSRRDLFARILSNEEDHVDTLEKQFDMIERMGLQNYIQLQSKPTEE